MPASLSPQTIAIVRATVPALAEHGAAITGAMYRRLFEDAESAALFSQANQQNGAQVHTLATTVLAYARNIGNLAAFWPGPNEDHYRITVERQVDGGASAFLHDHAVPGTIIECTPFADADCYLCGPRPFVRSFVSGLIDAGVPAGRVHYKLFGQTDQAMAA